MSSRKMCVFSLLVLTALWLLPARFAQAAEEKSGSSSGSATVTNESSNTDTTSTDSGDKPAQQRPQSQQQQQKPAKPSAVPAPPRRPGVGVSRGSTVIVGPDGEVREFSTGDGSGGMGGGMGGGVSGGGQFGVTTDKLRQLEDKLRKATDDMRTYQEELKRYGGDIFIGNPMPALPGIPSVNRYVTRGKWPTSDDPEARALDEKEQKILDDVKEIVEQYRSSKDQNERAELKKKLTDATAQQFDIRQQNRELEVKRLEKELSRIRDSIQQRTQSREQIIKRRVAQLLHEQDDLEF
jgi:hypothetical protein